jgi:hypothetical protein
MSRQKSKIIARKRPKSYPLTEQQMKFRQVIADCGIVKGMSREELIDKMKNCVPAAWAKEKEAHEEPLSGTIQSGEIPVLS